MHYLKSGFFLRIAIFGAVLAGPAKAVTILSFTLNTGSGNTATFGGSGFGPGVLSGISGWAPTSVNLTGTSGYAITSGTTTLTTSGTGNTTDTLTISGIITGLTGFSTVTNILTLTWTNDPTGTVPVIQDLYAGTTTINSTLLSDLHIASPVAGGGNGFSTNATVSGSSSGPVSGATGTYTVSSDQLQYSVTATPEPGSVLLLSGGLLFTGFFFRRRVLAAVQIQKQ